MVLVTGGTGLVGSHLMLELSLKGKKIRALLRAGMSFMLNVFLNPTPNYGRKLNGWKVMLQMFIQYWRHWKVWRKYTMLPGLFHFLPLILK